MTRFLRSIPGPRTIYSIVVEKQCVPDEDHPRGWAQLKKPVFVSRKSESPALSECIDVLEKFIVPRSCCMANTLYQYRVVADPEPPDDDLCMLLRCSNERIVLPKGIHKMLREPGTSVVVSK
jgi:hypothetical protein